MSSIVMTIHNFDHSYAGLSASEIQSSSCRHVFLLGRRVGNKFINETGDRHFQTHSGKRHREMWQQTFADNRDNPNFNFNEVIL
jgi:hypothetical protein